jgi:predicted Holliday junction resolvase-like endonuclease
MVKQLSPNIYKTSYLINDYAFIGKAINFMVFPTVGSMNILKIRMRKSEAVK